MRPDRSDPAVRAALRCERARRRSNASRTAACVALGLVALAGPFAAVPITGDRGATVGAVALSLLCVALAVAFWPERWSAAEGEHRELESIWREVRTDADRQVSWDRYAAWATSNDAGVDLLLVHCAPISERIEGAPSPFDLRVVRRVEAIEVETATEAMEQLRTEAARREDEAERRYEHRIEAAQDAAHSARLRQIDVAAAAQIRAGEERARREADAQEAAEDRAQADALARSLRRP